LTKRLFHVRRGIASACAGAPSGGWYLFAFGQALFVAGDVVAYNYVEFFGRQLPFPSIADVLYLAVSPAFVAGLLLLMRRRHRGRDRASLIDSLIIATGVGFLSWVFLIAPMRTTAASRRLRA
jgi:hypothetical protein